MQYWTILFLFTACLSRLSFAADSLKEVAETEWELKRDRDGIQIYTAEITGSAHNAVRAETIVEGVRLSALVAVIEDAEACAEWADRCAESYIVERPSTTEAIIYTHNDLPFPVSDRDVTARATWSQNPQTLEVMLESMAISGVMDEVRGRVRLTQATVYWQFVPLGENRVQIINRAHINPGSALPGWVTNMLLVDTPFETLEGMVDFVKRPEYRDAEIEFVTEPE